jgi:hypothetical protein
MGQGAPVVNDARLEHTNVEHTKPSEPRPEEIERQIDLLREQLDGLVDELDRRRHRAFDWGVQLRKHSGAIALGAGAVVTLVALAGRRRRRRPLGEHLAALLRGAYAIGEHPERLERLDDRWPALAGQLARSAALAGASVVVRRMAQRALNQSW